MCIKQRILLYILLPVLFICGCAYPPHKTTVRQSQPMDFPEEIYVWPNDNPFKHSRVWVCWFGEAAYAKGTGKLAAEALVDDLLKKRVFSYVSMAPSVGCDVMTCGMDPAGLRGHDLMITGDVTYYMDGSDYMAASVMERISVVHVPTGRILWSASANSQSEPVPSRDYLLFQSTGTPAQPTSVLMQRNAAKFSNMLLNQPVQKSHGGQANNRPMLRVHRAALEDSQAKVKHLREKNELLEEQLLKTVEKGKSLQEEVDALSVQADQLEIQLKEKIDKGENTLKRDKGHGEKQEVKP